MAENKFSQYQHHGKCDVCGKDGQVVVCCSALGPFSFAYCEECLNAKAEPYWFVVNTVAICGEWPNDVNEAYQKIIRDILKYLNKSEEEFKEDVRRASYDM